MNNALDDVLVWRAGGTPWIAIAEYLGVKPASLERTLRRHNYPELARECNQQTRGENLDRPRKITRIKTRKNNSYRWVFTCRKCGVENTLNSLSDAQQFMGEHIMKGCEYGLV